MRSRGPLKKEGPGPKLQNVLRPERTGIFLSDLDPSDLTWRYELFQPRSAFGASAQRRGERVPERQRERRRHRERY